MHRILLRLMVLDLAPDTFEQTRTFWSDALGAHVEPGWSAEYSWLQDVPGLDRMLVQRLQAGAGRVHLDLETDDIPAEVARLERLGATHVRAGEQWQVMRDPAGLEFCVVPASDGFDARARTVDD
jgi:hypothetical protein